MLKDVTSRTITGILVTAIIAGFWWIYGNLASLLWGVWGGVMYPVPVPVFLLVLLSGATFFLIFAIVADQVEKGKGPMEPQWFHFTEFEYHGLCWRWVWFRNQISSLRAYCRACKRFVQYHEEGVYADRTIFHCQNCGQHEVRKSHKQIQNEVKIEIEHIIETGRWKEFVATEAA